MVEGVVCAEEQLLSTSRAAVIAKVKSKKLTMSQLLGHPKKMMLAQKRYSALTTLMKMTCHLWSKIASPKPRVGQISAAVKKKIGVKATKVDGPGLKRRKHSSQ